MNYVPVSLVVYDCTLQLRIEARDGGTPPRSATALVNINVQRNLVAPVFQQSSYQTTILETQSLGVNILRVVATDADTKVRTCDGIRDRIVAMSWVTVALVSLRCNSDLVSCIVSKSSQLDFDLSSMSRL